MKCSIVGCKNVSGDIYVLQVGYICDECKEKFKDHIKDPIDKYISGGNKNIKESTKVYLKR